MTEGVLWISGKIKEIGQFENFSLIDSLTKNIINMISAYEDWLPPVSYTHLDVYKRQA